MLVFEMLEKYAKTQPNKVITSYLNREKTYGELYEEARNLASYLVAKGYKKDDIIAIYLPNSDDFIISYFAIQIAGLAVMPVNTKLAPSEVDYIFNHSEAKALIYDHRYAEFLKDVPSLSNFEEMIVVNGNNTFEDIISDGSIPFQQPRVAGDDTAVVFYTSGTTGKPKGVMLSASNVRAITKIWSESMEFSANDRMHIVTPLFHCAASHCFAIPTIYSGGTVVIEEQFSPEKTLETMEQEKVTVFFGVPAIFSILLNTPKLAETDLSNLRLFTYGAAPMPYELIRKIKTLYPDFKVQNLYGQTENSPGATTLKDDYALEKVGSVGEPLPNTLIRVVDETGNDVIQGEVGEILTKGPQVMKGYLKNEEATKNALKDGWLYTGDLGRLDKEGLLYIVDRKKDMIIRGGENVYPVEVEEVLYEIPEILEVAVVGVPHEVFGEVPKAFIVLKEGESIQEADIISYCRKKLAKYKLPSEVVLIDELPRNASGKVLKHTLRNQVKA